jgi:hypothetical protein
MTSCHNCGRQVPQERFCVACGEPLATDARRGFAAAPHEPWWHPRIVSSIFPHLPRADMRSFRIALAAGVALVVALCLLRLYPLALVAAAIAVPLLFLLYLWDVDVYEDEPLLVLAFTVTWGAVAGALLGYAARQLSSQVALLRGSPDTHNLVWLGVILPCVGLALGLAGPLILLPYRNFNDVLDGVIFGGSCAATLLAAEALANSADFLHLGFRAAGNEGLWIARLLTLGVTMPVLAAGVGGATCGAFWLRFRSPDRDRSAVGPLGSPLLAVPVAAGVLVGAAMAELYLKQWWTLAVTAVAAALGILWLRRLIHLGLQEEAAEQEIGPVIECPSCHEPTPAHTFCGHCGAALHALPKARAPHAAEAPRKARIGGGVKIAVFSTLAAAAIGIAAIAIALSRPGSTTPACRPGVPCAAPPSSPVAAPHVVAGVFHSGAGWTSDRGVSLRYGSEWHLVRKGSNGLVLQVQAKSGLYVVVLVLVEPSTIAPADALQSQVDDQPDGFLGVQQDTSSSHEILSPQLGFVHGVAAMYSATVDQPPSPGEKVEIAFEAARRNKATVVVEAITNETAQGANASAPYPAFQVVDELLGTLQWP